LIDEIGPDLIHSHFVSTTLMLRIALGRNHPIPRIFQVPGPLHLEHWHTKRSELALAGANDFWIGSSRFILQAYENAGINGSKRFLSYYSAQTDLFSAGQTGYLRNTFKIPDGDFVVGNINLIYPPKTYLGHRVGLKCHEDVIEAIRLVQRQRSGVWGVLIGATFGKDTRYEQKIRELADRKGHGRILMPGHFPEEAVARAWPDFDCAVHVPMSENCGGVVEPLLSHVPTIAGDVGGLPEVVQAGVTGELVPIRQPKVLAHAIMDVIDRRQKHQQLAARGGRLASVMFNSERCGTEIFRIYRHILCGEPRPKEFDSKGFLSSTPDHGNQDTWAAAVAGAR
jgi:glycosyltransferase involved in cell wall biosynthesis